MCFNKDINKNRKEDIPQMTIKIHTANPVMLLIFKSTEIIKNNNSFNKKTVTMTKVAATEGNKEVNGFGIPP